MEIDFVTCPKCKCKNWVDIPNTEDKSKYKFRCARCSYTITLGSCGKCKTEKAWIQTQGIDEKGGHRPVYRYQCRHCGRVVGIMID
ncbi:MAG: hypothetical protein MJ159_01905 [Treponemataceae bacterium]|nr:hypothetical protein [Treponemataceae bacterium]